MSTDETSGDLTHLQSVTAVLRLGFTGTSSHLSLYKFLCESGAEV